MEKLELKYLKGYLGTGLKCYAMGEATEESTGTDDEKPQLFTIEGMNSTWIEVSGRLETVNDEINIEDCIPLLLPLSALTETLEDDSVPIVELAKMAFGEINILDTTQKDGLYAVKFTDEEDDTTVFSYNTNVCLFQADYMDIEELERRITIVPRQLQLFEYLYSKHFDINGLIPAGLAIDKRTIK